MTTNIKAQDISFSQFDLNMLYMNPALAGFEQDFRILTARRNQWVGIVEKFNSNISRIVLLVSRIVFSLHFY